MNWCERCDVHAAVGVGCCMEEVVREVYTNSHMQRKLRGSNICKLTTGKQRKQTCSPNPPLTAAADMRRQATVPLAGPASPCSHTCNTPATQLDNHCQANTEKKTPSNDTSEDSNTLWNEPIHDHKSPWKNVIVK